MSGTLFSRRKKELLLCSCAITVPTKRLACNQGRKIWYYDDARRYLQIQSFSGARAAHPYRHTT